MSKIFERFNEEKTVPPFLSEQEIKNDIKNNINTSRYFPFPQFQEDVSYFRDQTTGRLYQKDLRNHVTEVNDQKTYESLNDLYEANEKDNNILNTKPSHQSKVSVFASNDQKTKPNTFNPSKKTETKDSNVTDNKTERISEKIKMEISRKKFLFLGGGVALTSLVGFGIFQKISEFFSYRGVGENELKQRGIWVIKDTDPIAREQNPEPSNEAPNEFLKALYGKKFFGIFGDDGAITKIENNDSNDYTKLVKVENIDSDLQMYLNLETLMFLCEKLNKTFPSADKDQFLLYNKLIERISQENNSQNPNYNIQWRIKNVLSNNPSKPDTALINFAGNNYKLGNNLELPVVEQAMVDNLNNVYGVQLIPDTLLGLFGEPDKNSSYVNSYYPLSYETGDFRDVIMSYVLNEAFFTTVKSTGYGSVMKNNSISKSFNKLSVFGSTGKAPIASKFEGNVSEVILVQPLRDISAVITSESVSGDENALFRYTRDSLYGRSFDGKNNTPDIKGIDKKDLRNAIYLFRKLTEKEEVTNNGESITSYSSRDYKLGGMIPNRFSFLHKNGINEVIEMEMKTPDTLGKTDAGYSVGATKEFAKRNNPKVK